MEYCPDNTCERLTTPSMASKSELEDFAFLYLLKVSGYAYLKDTRPEDEVSAVARVTKGYSRECSIGGGDPDLECVLKLLHQRASIKLYFIRYDEGRKCVKPQPLLGQPSGFKTRCTGNKAAN